MKKNQLSFWAKQVSQILSIAKNQSIYWYSKEENNKFSNKNIAIYFENNSEEVKYFWINNSWESFNENLLNEENLIKKINIWKNIHTNNLKIDWNIKNEIIILFPSIKWKTLFFTKSNNIFTKINWEKIEISVKYKNSTNQVFTKQIEYNNITNLINYK